MSTMTNLSTDVPDHQAEPDFAPLSHDELASLQILGLRHRAAMLESQVQLVVSELLDLIQASQPVLYNQVIAEMDRAEKGGLLVDFVLTAANTLLELWAGEIVQPTPTDPVLAQAWAQHVFGARRLDWMELPFPDDWPVASTLRAAAAQPFAVLQTTQPLAQPVATPPLTTETSPSRSGEPGERDLELVRAIGQEGIFLQDEFERAFARLPDVSSAGWTERTRQEYARQALSRLADRGLLERLPINLRVSSEVWKAIGGGGALKLTADGAQLYTRLTGQLPQDRLSTFVDYYKTLEAGALVLIVKRLLEQDASARSRHWNLDIVDAITGADADLEHIGAQRSYTRAQARAFPDLAVRLTPTLGGASKLILVEVEVGAYALDKLRAKLERNLLCYPPLPIYYLVPTETVAKSLMSRKGKVKSEIEMAVERVTAQQGLPHGCQVVVYSLASLLSTRLRSPRELEKLKYYKSCQSNGTATPDMLTQIQGLILPRIFFGKADRPRTTDEATENE